MARSRRKQQLKNYIENRYLWICWREDKRTEPILFTMTLRPKEATWSKHDEWYFQKSPLWSLFKNVRGKTGLPATVKSGQRTRNWKRVLTSTRLKSDRSNVSKWPNSLGLLQKYLDWTLLIRRYLTFLKILTSFEKTEFEHLGNSSFFCGTIDIHWPP